MFATTALTPGTGTGTGTRPVLDRAVAAMGLRRRAEVEVLEAALAWAHAHVVDPDTDPDGVAGWRSDIIHTPGSAAALFGERALPIAGAGTPAVAEFAVMELAVMELAAVLDLSHEATLALLGDVLDLAHRLPQTWALVRELRVPVRLAREAARESRDLSLTAAGHADRLLAWQPRRLNPHRVGVLVHEARLYADPDRAIADHDRAMDARGVEVHHEEGALGTSEVFMTLDTADAIAFDHTVSTMAHQIGALGYPGSRDVRRAHAVGIMASPQQALDLLAADPNAADADHDPAVVLAEDIALDAANPFRRPTRPGHRAAGEAGDSGEVVLVLHVTDRDLLAGDVVPGRNGVVRSPKLGPVLMSRMSSWLMTAGKVTIKPVVDAHDPPARMAAAVRFRDLTCVYPHCGRAAESCDLDHIEEYVPPDEGGPPGQTSPERLAPLCRRHHRAKTFGAFTYRRLDDGSYEWTLPSGRHVTTDPLTPRPQPPPRRRRT